jgi:hypothetical protein
MLIFLAILVLVTIAAVAAYTTTRRRTAAGLAEAQADADHWYGRLGGQVVNLPGDGDVAVRQALADAAERYTSAGAIRSSAQTVPEFRAVSAVSVEGLHFIRAARTAMGLDPGPELPTTIAQSTAGALRSPQSVLAGDGQSYAGGPRQNTEHGFYYPGGMVGGRPVPGGWYTQPFWKGAAIGGIAAVGGALLLGGIADTLTGGGFGGDRWVEGQSGFGEGGFGEGSGGDFGGGDW